MIRNVDIVHSMQTAALKAKAIELGVVDEAEADKAKAQYVWLIIGLLLSRYPTA